MRSGEKASQCAKKINIYPQVLLNVPVAPQYKTEYMKNPIVAQEIKRDVYKRQTHSMDEALKAQRMIVMDTGRIVLDLSLIHI